MILELDNLMDFWTIYLFFLFRSIRELLVTRLFGWQKKNNLKTHLHLREHVTNSYCWVDFQNFLFWIRTKKGNIWRIFQNDWGKSTNKELCLWSWQQNSTKQQKKKKTNWNRLNWIKIICIKLFVLLNYFQLKKDFPRIFVLKRFEKINVLMRYDPI